MKLPTAPSPRISDKSLELALDWLRDNAAAIGRAKERHVLAEHMVRHVEALEMKKHGELSAVAQKREALASEAYKAAILEDAKAAGAYEELKSRREAASAKIEAWRTEQANFRSMKI